jgi:hypothetical protein
MLRAMLRGKSGAALTAPSAPDGWSPLQVVLHVRSGAAIIAPRVMQALVADAPAFASFDERGWADLLARAEVPLDAQLTAFQIELAELVAVLMSLSEHQWQRSGKHEERGEQTVLAICEQLAEHEAEHVAQVRAMVAGA